MCSSEKCLRNSYEWDSGKVLYFGLRVMGSYWNFCIGELYDLIYVRKDSFDC